MLSYPSLASCGIVPLSFRPLTLSPTLLHQSQQKQTHQVGSSLKFQSLRQKLHTTPVSSGLGSITGNPHPRCGRCKTIDSEWRKSSVILSSGTYGLLVHRISHLDRLLQLKQFIQENK